MSQELFDEAVRLEEEGHQEVALGVWRQLAEASPTRNVFLRLGSIAQDLGLIEDAEHAFKRALEIDGRSTPALKALGCLAIFRRDYGAAEDYLKQACAIEEDPVGLTLLGVALGNTCKGLEAQEACRRAIRIDPKYEEAYYNLAVLLRHDRPAEAQMLFRTALELDPVYALAHRELGWLLHRRGDSPQAGMHLRKAIELEPDDGLAHIYLGNYLWQCAEGDEAMAEFRIAEALKPGWAVPLWCQGDIYENRHEDLDLAQACFERALQFEPECAEALKNLGRLFMKRGQVDLAREYLNRALRLSPGSGRVQKLLSALDEGRSE